MLAWLVDHANLVFVLLGLTVLALSVAWWLNRRVRTLLITVGVVGLMAVLWLLTLVVPTDRKQIATNLWAMATAVRDNKPNDLVKLWSKDFNYRDLKREDLARGVTEAAHRFRVESINLWDIDFRSLTPDKCEVWFHCAAHAPDGAFPMLCKSHFVKEGEQWRLVRVAFFRAIANTNEEIALPVGR